MAYYVEQVKGKVHITAENWKRFQQNFPVQFDENGNLRYWGPQSFSACWNPPYFENGEARKLWCCCEEGWNEACLDWLEYLAPYVEDGSEVIFLSDYTKWWGYRFENGELVEANAAIVSIPRNTDLEALKHDFALGKLTVEQASQILDILGQLQR